MNKMTLLIAATMVMAGCKSFTGNFKVSEPITLKTTKVTGKHCSGKACDDWRKVEKIELDLQPDTYGAKVKIESKKKIKLELKGKKKKSKYNISFKVPKGTKLPERSGEFSIAAGDSGQPYAVHGDVDTETETSESHRGNESCSWTETVEHCYWTGEPGRPARDSKYVCETEYVTHWGNQEVEYYYWTETTTVAFDLVSPGAANASASFSGSHYESDKIYTYQGHCY